MQRFEDKDPLACELYKDPSKLRRSWVCAVLTQNLFKATPSADAGILEVKVTDRFGESWSVKFENKPQKSLRLQENRN